VRPGVHVGHGVDDHPSKLDLVGLGHAAEPREDVCERVGVHLSSGPPCVSGCLDRRLDGGRLMVETTEAVGGLRFFCRTFFLKLRSPDRTPRLVDLTS
jgi:hypothetical protein